MAMDIQPAPDTWYRETNGDRMFVVTSYDEVREIVEIQHYDGEVEEIDLDDWVQLDLELAEAPEDWSGAMDRVDEEDLDDGEAAARNVGRQPRINGELM